MLVVSIHEPVITVLLYSDYDCENGQHSIRSVNVRDLNKGVDILSFIIYKIP